MFAQSLITISCNYWVWWWTDQECEHIKLIIMSYLIEGVITESWYQRSLADLSRSSRDQGDLGPGGGGGLAASIHWHLTMRFTASLSGIIIQSFFWQLTLDIVLINVGHCIKMSFLPFHHFLKITSEQLIEVTSYMTFVTVFVISRVCSPASYLRLSRSHTDTRHILASHWSMAAVTRSASANQRQGETLIEFRKT